MAYKLLNHLLSLKKSPKDLIDWLTSDELDETRWMDFGAVCSKEEFLSYFLTYLQIQFDSPLQNNSGPKSTPAKKIVSQSPTTSSPFPNRTNSLNQDKSNVDICRSSSLKNNIIDSRNKNVNSTPVRHNSSEIDRSNEGKKIVSNNSISLVSPQISTNTAKNQNLLPKKRVELKGCDSNQIGSINPLFKENCDYEQNNTTKSTSFYDESFPSLGKSSSSSAFSTPKKNESSDLFYSNLSQKSNSSTPNNMFQSPLSPLYNNSLSTISPINARVQNKYKSPNCHKNYQQNLTSTPDRTANNRSNNSKSHSRQNISLGDFVVIENRSGKKGSGKKSNNTKLLVNEEQNIDSQKDGFSDTSSSHSYRNSRRKKKVNPTPLDFSNEKERKENAAFSDVPRPFTQNPQFVNVSPIDKSVDNESFQVERGLVKIERQKKPETCSSENKDSRENITNEPSQQRWKILPSTPSKSLQLNDLIIPNKELVDNIQILNVLIEVYSSLLDHNLVLNPMTELYFIIRLITVQYTNSKKSSSVKKNVESRIAEDNESSNCLKKNLSVLRKSLNFDELLEEQVNNNADNNIGNKVEIDTFLDGSSNVSSTMADNSNDSNNVNNVLKELSLNESNSEELIDLEDNKKLERSSDDQSYVKLNLCTPHNCVYFSTQVLNRQREFIKCLDRVTLKLLYENSLIASFQPELCKYLDLIYKAKVIETSMIKSLLNIGTGELNVCFQMETDNNEKFPSAPAFVFFRKQRDMFYDILKIWEDNHLRPGWTFQISLASKIKNMLTLHVDVTNLTHFTRLFKSQMLISCVQSGNEEDLLDEETASFLKNLKDSNPAKFTQLQKKFVTPLSPNGPVPLPSFPGTQEFYKDFILCAAIPAFYAYLENTFVHEIMELNNSQFVGSDIEDKETDVDEQTKQNFVACLSSLRLLAKFLGFLTALPYRSDTSMLEDVISSQVVLRSQCLPRIDLQHCLQSALTAGKLSLTVPWVVEYLAMMDHAALRLPYYKRVLEMLYCFYRASNYNTAANSEELMSQKTAILLKLSIGWLFELPVFPKEFYCAWQFKYNSRALKTMLSTKTECDSLTEVETSIVSVKPNLFLDKLEIVDDRILYNCCPFLKELNILLTSGNSNVNSSTSYRHVTPVTSQLEKSNTTNTTAKHLEIQLEEAFFHGQPMSTRKTVEYVSERVASSCVKYICNNLLSDERKKNSQALQKIVEENYSTFDHTDENLINSLSKDIDRLSMKAVHNIKEKIEKVIPEMCESRVSQSITSLLSEDCLDAVRNMCIKIAVRMAMDRIDQWTRSHTVGGSVFMKDMHFELKKSFKLCNEVIVDKKHHNPTAPSPTDIINEFRTLIWNLLESKGNSLTEDTVSMFWDQFYRCLTERTDLKAVSEKMLSSLSIDLCLFLMSYRNDLFTDKVQEKIFKVWQIDHLKISEQESPLSRLLSPRNIELMTRSGSHQVWSTCGKFIKKLLKELILPLNILCEQAVAVLRIDWNPVIMKNLSVCLNEAIDNYKSNNEETESIRYLLGWVAGACNDMDEDSFTFS